MHALIVYESVYGNTHAVAAGIAAGLEPRSEAKLVPLHDATEDLLSWADVVIVGGPTHAHGLTSASSRKGARESANDPKSGLTLDPDAVGPGLRDWFRGLTRVQGKSAVAFDTRFDASALLTGRASHGIARRLRGRGFTLVTQPESFLVDKHNQLLAGETDRAALWGAHLADVLGATT
jgi:hypothetical protein